MKHSIFSASAAHRWANCAGALALAAEAEHVESYDNVYSLEGTAGHGLSEQCLRDGGSPTEHVGEIITLPADFGSGPVQHPVEITDDLALACQTYVEYVRGLGGALLVEVKANYASLLGADFGTAFGTSDAVVLSGNTVHVVDLKLGRSYVNPANNKQLTLYAAGIVDALEAVGEDIENVCLTIVQPRVTAAPQSFTMTRAELASATDTLRTAAQRVREAFAASPRDSTWEATYLTPGEEQCRWCPMAATCPALRRQAYAAMDAEIEVLTPDDVLAEALAKVPLMEQWVEAVQAEAMRRLVAGESVTGFKLVQGREGNRRWVDEAAVKQTFGNDPMIYAAPSILTVAQLEKVLKKSKDGRLAQIEGLVTRSPAKPTVAKSDDPRPTWVNTVSDEDIPLVQ